MTGAGNNPNCARVLCTTARTTRMCRGSVSRPDRSRRVHFLPKPPLRGASGSTIPRAWRRSRATSAWRLAALFIRSIQESNESARPRPKHCMRRLDRGMPPASRCACHTFDLPADLRLNEGGAHLRSCDDPFTWTTIEASHR